MIIGVGGKKNHGKDTIGDYLVDVYKFDKLSFALKGKTVICETFGITLAELESFKNEPLISVRLYDNDQAEPATISQMSFREFIQKLLNEGMKSAYGDLFHVNQLLPLDFVHIGHKYVICDVRFPFEAMRIKELGGVVWEVQRPNVMLDDKHSSEEPLPRELVDFQIFNDSDKDHLYEQIDQTLNRMLDQVEV